MSKNLVKVLTGIFFFFMGTIPLVGGIKALYYYVLGTEPITGLYVAGLFTLTYIMYMSSISTMSE